MQRKVPTEVICLLFNNLHCVLLFESLIFGPLVFHNKDELCYQGLWHCGQKMMKVLKHSRRFLSKIYFKASFPPQIISEVNTLRCLSFPHSFPAGRRLRPVCPPVPASLWAQAGTVFQIFIALKHHTHPNAGASYRLRKSLVSINSTR